MIARKDFIPVMIIVTGVFLFIATAALFFMLHDLAGETVENRRIACIGRYLDGEKYAPECQEFIDGR